MVRSAARRLASNPRLRALLAAWAGFGIGSASFAVLTIVLLFAEGGAAAVGVATVLRVVPGAVLAPIAAGLAASARPQFHLAMGIGGRVLAMIATTFAALHGASVVVIFVIVFVDSILSVAVRPLHSALMVRLADTPEEAAAATSATGSLFSATGLAGPALAGLALAFTGIGWAYALPTGAFVVALAAALMIKAPCGEAHPDKADGWSVRAHLKAVRFGFRSIVASRAAGAATGLFFLNMMLTGVWFVVSAPVANIRLGLGAEGITTVVTLASLGGLIGSLATLPIVGRHGLGGVLVGAMIGVAAALAAIGSVHAPIAGLGLAICLGAASSVVFAVAPTLLQRSVATGAMAPAAACLQSLAPGGNAVGAGLAVVLTGWLGVPAALAIVGAAGAVVTAFSWPLLRHAGPLDQDAAANLAVIRATAMLAPLPVLAMEQLARAATRLTVPKGAEVIRQGDPGDRFYMIAAGLADVTVDGRRMATLGIGGSFGEIALLHEVTRSASVVARDDLELVVVDHADFLGALSIDPAAFDRGGEIATMRLHSQPTEERLVELDREVALRGRSVFDLLRSQPPLADIGEAGLRQLVDAAKVLGAADGAMIIREGDHGCSYYVILDGAAEVHEGSSLMRTLGPGGGFGERAILRDIPRTSTVRAVGDVTLVAVDRGMFQRVR